MSEEESRKRSEEQKRLREAKDRKDREEAAKKTIVENTPRQAAEEARTPPAKGSRSVITTGRQGSIGNAISAFNQLQSPTTTETPIARKEPIIIPKDNNVQETQSSAELPTKRTNVETEVTTETKSVDLVTTTIKEPVVEELNKKKEETPTPPPDVIPTIEIEHVATPPATQSPVIEEKSVSPTEVESEEPLYQNQAELVQQQQQQEQKQQQQQQVQYELENNVNNVTNTTTNNGEQLLEEAIYANSENLADYLEDTGLRAIALYDYQAADDDEISFDPDDIVTHIEMIDEGWWRGLCKNRYGLFPANYVQLISHSET